MTEDEKAVTVLGLGAMGTALAGAFLAAGRPTTVWNRTPGKAGALVAGGAVEAATIDEAARASRLVVVCLWDHRSVQQALDPVAGALAGRTVVNLTNGTPGQGRELAGWARRHGAAFLDGGIMAVPPMIGGPGAFVLYSGAQEVFDAHRDALDALGETMWVGADPGLAALHDLALLSAMYGVTMGELHAFAMVRSAGLSTTAFAPLLRRWTDAMSGFQERMAAQMEARDYTTGVVSNLAMQAAAFHNFYDAAHEQGVSPELIAPLYPLMQRRLVEGGGAEDLTGLVELLNTRRTTA
ncbi:6-phosphogluconate dehydrogenase [Pseudonocardia sp. MH-G8]|nr:NAD(P)-binding domain-containing protein [Pseudonocardia sp. MH-G8]OZM77785.1 6-phosphogluconate dehydrogenase [Pseudonocardia sp. MH-G8]